MLKKIKNNNKGSFSLWQRGFLYIVMLCVFTFVLDICILCLELQTTSHQLAYVAEKLSFQGGFIGSKTPSSQYWSNSDIYNYFNKSLVRFGVDGKNLHWKLYVNEGGADINIIDTENGQIIKTGYVSGGKKPPGEVSKNYTVSSKIMIYFDHKYFFSGKVFGLNPVVKRYCLTDRYINLYINN